jgi:hypothetical protein
MHQCEPVGVPPSADACGQTAPVWNPAEWPVQTEWPDVEHYTPPACLLIAGFRRTGKNVFGEDVRRGTFSYPWVVHGRPDAPPLAAPSPFSAFANAPIVAFADPIRSIVSGALGLGPAYDFDANKDTCVVAGKKVRQHLIDAGTAGRAVAKSFWARATFAPHFTRKPSERAAVICTDWRFAGEHAALVHEAGVRDIITVRLFRREVPIPDRCIESEHDIDNVAATFLCVPDEDHMAAAIAAFPVYANYIPLGRLVP